MAREIILNGSQNVVVVTREETTLLTDKISIDTVSDDGNKVVVRLSFFNSTGLTRLLTLWEGQDYVNIGNWTDDDVNNRIKELLNVT
jgi:hypothetical protein